MNLVGESQEEVEDEGQHCPDEDNDEEEMMQMEEE